MMELPQHVDELRLIPKFAEDISLSGPVDNMEIFSYISKDLVKHNSFFDAFLLELISRESHVHCTKT